MIKKLSWLENFFSRWLKPRHVAGWYIQLFGVVMGFFGLFTGMYLGIDRLAQIVFASDTSQVWNFASSGDYQVSDSTLIAVASNTAALIVQNYTSTAQTTLLLHLDEASGNPTDSSSYGQSPVLSGGSYGSGKLNNALTLDGVNQMITVPDSAAISLSQANTLEAWVKLGSSFSNTSHIQRQGIFDKGDYQLYFDNDTGRLTYELANSGATTWAQVAGNDLNGSWDLDGQVAGHVLKFIGTDLYVGLGNGTGDAEVWRRSGSTWTKIGGDGVNSGWAVNTYESVTALTTDGTDLYAGLGTTAGDGEVWKWNGSSWTKIGGDGINSGWIVNTYETVRSLEYFSGSVYAGLGDSAGDAEVWRWNGATWTKVGGDSTNSGWATTYEYVYAMYTDGTYLYAALGASTTDAEVWRWNGTAWTKIGGDGVNSSWNTNYEVVTSLTGFGTNLYVGIGTTAGDAEVWRWNGTVWTQIGGDTLNSGWDGTSYETVYSLTNDGTNLYAGLGVTAGDNEVWRWNGTAWTKIGGDNVNSGFGATANHLNIEAMIYGSSTLYALMTSGNANRSAELWSFNGTVWSQVGGNYVESSWGFRGLQNIETMTVAGDYLYAGTGYTVAGNALIWRWDGSSWTIVGGNGVNSSWTAHTYEDVLSMLAYNGELYVGLGTTANDAEVWKFNGTVWSQVGGDSLNSGWTTNFEEISSMATFQDNLYVGLGNSANDAEVWRWNGSSWTKVGGDSLNSGWTTNYERVTALSSYGNYLYAGLGSSAGDSEVWRYNGSVWAKVGGDGLTSSWDGTAEHEQVNSMIVGGGELYAGLGTGTGDADVWKYDGSTWTQIGGDDLNNSWTTGTYERVKSLVTYNGDVYVALGYTAGDGEVWRWNGSSWSQVGGDLVNDSWTNAIEEISAFSVYKGKLYAGTGNTQNADAAVWSYGNNGFLQSSNTSTDTNWHHYAATYDGTTMKLYKDGVLDNSIAASLTLPDSSRSLQIGATYGGREAGKAQGYLAGSLDEVRISNTALTSFNTSAYTASAQTVAPVAAVMTSGMKNFDAFSATETTNGGVITYRLSDDAGSSWLYWDGSEWSLSADTSLANSASEVNAHMSDFPVTTQGILWQAILDGDGSQAVTLSEVSIGGIADTTAPNNPDTLTALSAAGGSAITTDTWYAGTAPVFSWSGASDSGGAGVAGYYVYFGTDETADPLTAGTLQESATYSASGLTSGATYYLRIKTKDSAQNVSGVTWAPFNYQIDSTAPTNPSTISVSPAGYAASDEFTFTWLAASDAGSAVAGYQYKTGTSSGVLADWSATTTAITLTLSDIAYQTDANSFYLRTVDAAGNVSSPLEALYYFAGEGASVPLALGVNPASNTENSFAFSWSAPETYLGDASALTYCYTVNTLPSVVTCSFTSAGATSLSASAFATQTGINTFYLVAKNSSESGGAINYGAYTSVTFTANTTAPGIPLNADIADVSVKNTSSWKLALSWEAPADAGSGVASYEIYRSADGTTFTEIATTTGIAYVDTGLEQQEYSYKVRACDNVANCGAYSSTVSLLPNGKYTEAANLSSGPTTSAITTKQATISWVTDRNADSKVQYGTGAGSYFTSEPSNSTATTDHSIILTNLTPGTTYYYRVKWTDEDGNTGVSAEKTFTTDPAPTAQDVAVRRVGLSSATVQFITTGASSVKIFFGKTTSFGGVVTLATSTAEGSYTVDLADLEDGVKYYYKLNMFDAEGNEYEGTILSFETPPRPKVNAVKIQQVKNTAQPTVLISWTANTPTSSIVTYYPQDNPSQARDEVNVALQSGEHKMLVRNLNPETPYVLVVKGRDRTGNEATSEPQYFTTATDTRPAKISDLKVESSILTTTNSGNQEATAQLTVTWTTDESTTSQVEFGEGTGAVYSQKTQEDKNFTINHLVVISGLSPSRVYHLRALSTDVAGNVGESIDTVTITPKATDNALDLVVSNLQQVFGFLGK
ncbi:MAG TPA: hypothetical protein DEP87_03135 [Candidatus Pacebacteria bacterium]|nr:hypothetical protein [Candidatus Paceibacterota bacterium]